MAEGQISPWMPETDPKRIAALGKLSEECNELAGRAARAIIQGLDERDPDSGRTNVEELLREIADVVACIALLEDIGMLPANLFDLMDERMEAKLAGYREWHRFIDAAEGQ